MISPSSHAAEEFFLAFSENPESAGHPLVMVAETVSTNSDAMELGRKGAHTGTVVIAATQTGGRGRLGKKWISPVGGGLYFSILLRPALDPADLPKITLAAGVALCKAVSRFCHPAPMIKWPNDLLIDGRKCGGILTECEFMHKNPPLVVVGIGLNVFTPVKDFPEELRNKVTSLNRHAPDQIRLQPLLQDILTGVDTIMKQLEAGDFAAILKQWRAFDATGGKRLAWLTTGRRAITGISLGVDNEGRLHIRDDQGMIHEVLSGDIRLQSP